MSATADGLRFADAHRQALAPLTKVVMKRGGIPTKAKCKYGSAYANSTLLYNVATWGHLDDTQLRAMDHAYTTTYAHATNRH